MDWVPVPHDHTQQYLALAAHRTVDEVGVAWWLPSNQPTNNWNTFIIDPPASESHGGARFDTAVVTRKPQQQDGQVRGYEEGVFAG